MSKKSSLYISFAVEDNAKSSSGEGWVEGFVRNLRVYLQRINNHSPDIVLLDSKAKRPSKLEDGEGVVVILSKHYLQKKMQNLDAPLLSEGSNAFKVDLEPIAKSKQPKELRTLNEFYFFDSPSGSSDYELLSPSSDGPYFFLKIIDLAFALTGSVLSSGKKNGTVGKKIYLAETSYDQVQNRDEVKRELIRHGHTVLPQKPFSSDIKELENEVRKCLEESDLSVHIIGEDYGETPDGSSKSIVEIQNELSTQYFAENKGTEFESLHRLIWMPIYVKPRTDQQKLYLDQLKDDIVSTSGAEIIQTPLEILKTIIHSRLRMFDEAVKAKRSNVQKKSDHKVVYLLFDKKDESEIPSIVANIKSKNIEVILPQFEGKQIEFLDNHRQSLVRSDGVLLFANRNLNWVNSKLNDVVKAPGFGKQHPFEATALYIKDSSIPKDKIAAIGDLIMLNGEDKSKKSEIGPFLDKIASS